MTSDPVLYAFSGLPGTGKTTLAGAVAPRLGAAHLRIDTVEQGLREICSIDVQSQGYELAYLIATDILRAGVCVVADCCNPVGPSRRGWEGVAKRAGVPCVNIEVVCSDEVEHRRRIEMRESTLPRLKLPTWHEVRSREYATWTRPRIEIDTAGRYIEDCVEELLRELAGVG